MHAITWHDAGHDGGGDDGGAVMLTAGCWCRCRGGAVMLEKAAAVLSDEFPELGIEVIQPSEQDKRHGQAIAAGSLPALG